MFINAGLPFTRVCLLLFRQCGNIVIFPCLLHSGVKFSRSDFQPLLFQHRRNCVVCLNPRFCAGYVNGNITVDISGAKTRVEAYDAITAMLEQQGLKVGTAEFDAGMQQAWKDNNIAALPEK